MSHTNAVFDPREDISHPIDQGQTYEDDRTGEQLVLVFLSEDVALLRGEDGNHRLESRKHFEMNVGSGRFELVSDADGTMSAGAKVKKLNRLLEQYEDRDGRTAKHKASAIEEALDLIENNGRPDDNETIDFETVDGIGAKAAAELQKAGFTTKGDVRSAEKDEIVDVPYMGEKNTEALIDHVD